MAHELSGQVVLITGAGSGIGAELARKVSAAGAKVVLIGRRLEALAAVSDSLEGPAYVAACDVRNDGSIAAAMASTIEQFGKLDVLVNNAGVFDRKTLEDTSMDWFDQVIDTNLRGAYAFTKAAWPHLRTSRGQVLNISSIAGIYGFDMGSAYCASKHGLMGMNAALTIEGRPLGIRVMAICPASIDTKMWSELATEEERGRMMDPSEVAETCYWMLTRPRNVRVEPLILDNFTSPFLD